MDNEKIKGILKNREREKAISIEIAYKIGQEFINKLG